MFSTDHGDATGSHKHFEKSRTMYDEVFRIPLLARGPGCRGPTGAGICPPDGSDAQLYRMGRR